MMCTLEMGKVNRKYSTPSLIIYLVGWLVGWFGIKRGGSMKQKEDIERK